jgi:hypothetical protein
LRRLNVLTVKQPWAWALVCGGKRIENRSWQTPLRGWLAIHASRQPDTAGFAFLRSQGIICREESLVYGSIIGVVHLDAITPLSRCQDDPWASGPYCWHVSRAVALRKPIAVKGRMFTWSFDLPRPLRHYL